MIALAAAQSSSDLTWPDVAGIAVAAAFILILMWIVLRND